MSNGNLGQAVLITTEHRGVFFGYLVGEPSKEKVMIKNARNCISWTESEKGVFGLAERGPGQHCRIGPQVGEITLFDITSVSTVTPAAVERWEANLWVK